MKNRETALHVRSHNPGAAKDMVSRIIANSILLCLSVAMLLVINACSEQRWASENNTLLVFKHGKIAGDPRLFQELLGSFEREHPGITVRDETLPSSTDEQHQFYIINLEGGSSDFDVLSIDIIWVPEFARAGWLVLTPPSPQKICRYQKHLPLPENDDFLSCLLIKV